MKTVLLILSFLLIEALKAKSQETFQSVTNNGNTTTNRIAIGSTDDGISQLQVNGKITVNSGFNNATDRPSISSGTANFEIRSRSSTSYYADDGFLRLSAGGGTHSVEKTYIDISGYSTKPDMRSNIVLGTAGVERMRISVTGDVGIGTNTPDAKLAVNGTVHAKSIKVSQSDWPDYVFNSKYQLAPLDEVSKYIQEYGHLPDFPSSQEIDHHGLNLGDMQKNQMKKIEELTLYLINQDKQLKNLVRENNELKSRINKLEVLNSSK